MTTLTPAERSNIMRIMREHGAPDPTIAAAFGVSRQSVHSLLGPRPDPPAPDIPPLDALMSLPHDTLCELARIVDGDDGRTYIIELSMYGHISVMQGGMKFEHETLFDSNPRYAAVRALFD